MLAFYAAGAGDIHLRCHGVCQFSIGGAGAGIVGKGRAAEDIDRLILRGIKIAQPRQAPEGAVRRTKMRHGLHVHFAPVDFGPRQTGRHITVDVIPGIDKLVLKRQGVVGLPGEIPDPAVDVAFEHRPPPVVSRIGRVRHRVLAFVLRRAAVGVVERQFGGQVLQPRRIKQQLGPGVGGLDFARIADRIVGRQVDITATTLAIHADTKRQLILHQRAGGHHRQLGSVLIPCPAFECAFPFKARIFGGHHDRTGNRVTSLNVTLRPAEHLHALHIPQRLRPISLLVVGQ
ncbi:hypothetical protein D3C75_569100 [compost metagenome]